MPTPEAMTAAVHAYIDGYNRGDLDAIIGVFADNARVEDPVGTPPKIGHAALREFFSVGIGMGAKLHLDGPVRAEADSAAFAFHVMLDWEGQATRVDVIDVFRFDEAGKVAQMTAYFGPQNMGSA